MGQLFFSGELSQHLFEIDTACNEQIEYLIKENAKREGLTEEEKRREQRQEER